MGLLGKSRLMGFRKIISAMGILIFMVINLLPIGGYASELKPEKSKLINQPQNSLAQEFKSFKVVDFINAVAWSPNGNFLAALSRRGEIITVWDAKTGEVINEIHRYGGSYSGNSFGFTSNDTVITATPFGKSPDPRYDELAWEFSLMEWDIHTGEVVRYLPDRVKNPQAVKLNSTDVFTISNDQSFIAGISDKRVTVFSTKTGQLLFPPISIYTPWEVRDHTELIHSLAISPDGKELAIGTGVPTNFPQTGGGKVYFYDALTGKQLRSIFVYPKNPKTEDAFMVNSLVYDPSGQYIATSKLKMFNLKENNLTSVDIWDARNGNHVVSLSGKTISFGVTENIGGTMPLSWYQSLLVLGEGHALYFWSMQNPKEPLRLAVVDPHFFGGYHSVYSTAVSKDGMLAATLDNEVRLFQLSHY